MCALMLTRMPEVNLRYHSQGANHLKKHISVFVSVCVCVVGCECGYGWVYMWESDNSLQELVVNH